MRSKAWISVSMTKQMKYDVERYVEKHQYQKSEFIRELIRNVIYKHTDEDDIRKMREREGE